MLGFVFANQHNERHIRCNLYQQVECFTNLSEPIELIVVYNVALIHMSYNQMTHFNESHFNAFWKVQIVFAQKLFEHFTGNPVANYFLNNQTKI